MKIFSSIGLQSPTILLPNPKVNLTRWAVVACDQFTSQPDYWKSVEELVEDAPSTYHMILPEAYLGTTKEEKHASKVFSTMQAYLQKDIFREADGFVLVERIFENNTRRGLLAALDLESYDYQRDSKSLTRATEGTIIDRLPPRIAIRENAALEIPHIMVLIDDPHMTVIEPIAEKMQESHSLYDFDLMQGGGHIKGTLVNSEFNQKIVNALEELKSPQTQKKKYQTALDTPPLLYAMGDGNHSLATAKAIWEKNKMHLPENHPSRFALVELVNLHDPSIEFEAIHRLVKHRGIDLLRSCDSFFNSQISVSQCTDYQEMTDRIETSQDSIIPFGLFFNDRYYFIKVTKPLHTLAVGNVQLWLDHILQEEQIEAIDYIHGNDTINALGRQNGYAGIYLPAMPKNALFKSVIKDGPLPRKTFSMGEAHQKRYYLECRKII